MSFRSVSKTPTIDIQPDIIHISRGPKTFAACIMRALDAEKIIDSYVTLHDIVFSLLCTTSASVKR